MDLKGTIGCREAGDPWVPIRTPVQCRLSQPCPPYPRKEENQRKTAREMRKKTALRARQIILMQVRKRKKCCSNPKVVQKKPPGRKRHGFVMLLFIL